ncbi:MAG: 6-phosphofructokinase [Eubacteriales bacterium]|nr:6-phosphofructokinase [Eubacteriales bacterium]
MKGNLIFAQSGGPTSVINASAAGVILEALEHSENIEKVYGAAHGIVGVLNEDFYDLGLEDKEELKLLCQTPSSFLGSCRYKLANPEQDASDYERLLEVFKKYNIRYFFYNGGNDSMDTCNKISKFLTAKDYDCRVVGVPKTIDNDLMGTDHCPGYASAAKYIGTTLMEIYCDAHVYNSPQVTVVEIMGRHAGWLTAAAQLAVEEGYGPDYIYLPERAFDLDKCLADVERALNEKGKAFLAISEGCKTVDGKLLPELSGDLEQDSFGHKQLGGAALVLSDLIKAKFAVKVRAIELSLMQRCSAHLASKTDVEEAHEAGREAVRAALNGESDIMIGYERKALDHYEIEYTHFPLANVANAEKAFPDEWINEAGNGIKTEFMNYILPLIQGEPELKRKDSLPRFAKLKLEQAGEPTDYVK